VNKFQKPLLLVLPVVIVVCLVLIFRGEAKRRAGVPGQAPYKYTAYGVDLVTNGKVAFKIYKDSPRWPLKNPKTGNDCAPLYFCNECGAQFPGNIGGVTARCAECGGGNVGAYTPKNEKAFKARRSGPGADAGTD